MTPSLEQLFKQGLFSYRAGRTKPPHVSAAASGAGFDHQLENLIASRLSLDHQLLMRTSARARARALVAARKNNLIVARQALEESSTILLTSSLSSEAMYITSSFHNAVAAYIHYKHGRFDEARQHVLQALQTDGILIKEYGYKILELHRIQLGHNLLRIKVAQRQPDEAAQLCANLLSYIEGDQDRWPIPDFKIDGCLSAIPRDLLAAMFNQITGESAILLAGATGDETATVFLPLLDFAERNTPTDCLHTRAREWLSMKLCFLRKDRNAFLEQVAPFLQHGPGEIVLLWQASVIDLYECAESVDLIEALLLRKDIESDQSNWRPLPPQLRQKFAFTQFVG
jgi:hypothetical protein